MSPNLKNTSADSLQHVVAWSSVLQKYMPTAKVNILEILFPSSQIWEEGGGPLHEKPLNQGPSCLEVGFHKE